MGGGINHLDLFSGIGGFALAADRVFGNVTHKFVEYDQFCQAVIRKHWPNAEIHGDIYEFVADARHKDAQGHEPVATEPRKNERVESRSQNRPFILTGGFPCQPFSQAGRRQGTADDRYLWPPMFECVRLFRPEWVIAENVAGILTWNDGMVFETVCADLEAEGYEVQAFVIPACAVGAPHRRDRVWFVANRTHDGSGGRDSEERTMEKRKLVEIKQGRNEAWDQSQRRSWIETGWIEVATRLCGTHDGFSSWLDGYINDGVEWAVYEQAKRDEGQALRVLWQAIQSPEIRGKIGRFFTLDGEEVLLPFVCQLEQGMYTKWIHDTSAKASQDKLQELRKQREIGRSPYRRGTVEQLARELGAYLSELSQPGPQIERFLRDLWLANEGTGLLRETLSAIQEARRPTRRESQSTHSAMQVRRLTVMECEFLQGFPRNYTLVPHPTGRRKDTTRMAADGPRYKAIGNSWAVPCVHWIGQRIKQSLLLEGGL